MRWPSLEPWRSSSAPCCSPAWFPRCVRRAWTPSRI
jgi:hypothetical protein